MAGLDQATAVPGNAAALQQLAGAEQGLSQALGRFNMLMEAYPDLKASATMMQLSEEISSTENKVSFARQAYFGCLQSGPFKWWNISEIA